LKALFVTILLLIKLDFMNKKNSSSKLAHLASETLNNNVSSATAKTLAGSVLAQVQKGFQPSDSVQTLAGKVLESAKYNEDTKSLAASVVSQSPK
jgi:hypothetical protein